MRLNRRVLLCCTLAVLATAAPGHRALAQGTSGILPSPISGRDLDLYGEALDLTSEQRQAVDAFHDQYREDFRVLREAEIARYMEQVGGMFGRGLRSMDRKAIEESIRTLDRLMGRIRLIDDRLFDGIQSVLTDEQAARLSRAMQSRDRQRYRTGGSRMVGAVNRAARIDLARLHAGLELSEEERLDTEPFIIQYESRLTAATKALYQASARMFLDVVESLEEQGLSVDDPAAMMRNGRRMRGAMRTAFAEAVKKPRDKASAISDLNRRTLRQVSELLETGSAMTFRDRYLRRAYPEVPRTGASAAYRSYQAALNRRDLRESVRSDVVTAAALFRAGRVVVVEQMIDAVDAFRDTWSPMSGGRRGRDGRDGERTRRQEHEATLDEFRQRLDAIDKAGLEALYALVDDDLADTIRSAVASGSFDSLDAGGARGAATAANGPGGPAVPGLGPDPYLPTPITRRDIALYRDRLGLGDTDWYVLQSLHEEYVGNFTRVRQTDIAELRRAEAEAKAEPPTPERIDTVYELRARALTSIQHVDAMLFDDIETLIATDEQQPAARRLRLARTRFVYNRGLGENSLSMIFGGRNRRGGPGRGQGNNIRSLEAGVDVGRLVDEMDLTGEQRTETNTLLVEYETAATDGFRRQYESEMRLRRKSEKLRIQMQRSPGDGEQERRRQRNRWQGYRDLMEGDGRTAGEDRRFMVELNRATLSTIADALPEDLAETLRDAYNRSAFPGLYDNPRAAGRYLVAALELTDLESAQRAGIERLHAEYAPEQRRIAERMREFYADSSQVTGADRQQWRARRQRRNRLEVLEFDRREVNSRALRRLRDILTDIQEARLRLPAGATPGGDDDRSF